MAKTPRRSSRTSSAKRPPSRRLSATRARSSPPKHEPTRGLYGWITHTDLSSTDPAATKAWCANGSEYHLFAYSEKGGGGIRRVNADERPGSLPYVHVQDATASFDEAVRAGAEVVSPPQRVMEGSRLRSSGRRAVS